MNIPAVLRVIGALLLWTSVAMVPSVALSIVEGNLLGWLVSAAVTALAGLVLWMRMPNNKGIDRRAGLVVVGLGWLCLVTVGSLPFILTGVAPNLVGAFFESWWSGSEKRRWNRSCRVMGRVMPLKIMGHEQQWMRAPKPSPGLSGAIRGGRAPNDENDATRGEVLTESSPGSRAQLG